MKHIFLFSSRRRMLQISLLSVLLLIHFSLPHLLMGQQITYFSPESGTTGDTISIHGSGFGSSLGNHHLYFGGVKGNIITVTPTIIQAIVPAGATYHRLILVYNGFHSFSPRPFLPSYEAGGIIDCESFDYPVMKHLVANFPSIIPTDVNGDQKIDLFMSGGVCCSGALTVLLNTSTPGIIDSSSISIQQISGPYLNHEEVQVIDIDGDGLEDLASAYTSVNDTGFAVQLNTSTLTNISFDPPQKFGQQYATTYHRSLGLTDFDLDGKLDAIVVSNSVPTEIEFFENTSTPGSISFQSMALDTFTNSFQTINISDLDGDGKADILLSGISSVPTGVMNIAVLLNTSSPGNYSFTHIPLGMLSFDNFYLADWNQDGLDDIIIDEEFFPNQSTIGNIQFGPSQGDFPYSDFINLGDLNGDQILDYYGAFHINTGYFDANGMISLTRATSVDYLFESNGYNGRVGNVDWDGDSRPDLLHFKETNFNGTHIRFQRNNHVPAPAVPKILSISPHSGIPGDTLTILGDNFSTTSKVWMTSTFAEILSINDSSISVLIPSGSGIGKVKVLSNGYTAASLSDFVVGPSQVQSLYGFDPAITFQYTGSGGSNTASRLLLGDGDGDGQIEIYLLGSITQVMQDDWSTSVLDLSPVGSNPINLGGLGGCTFGIRSMIFDDVNGDQQMDLVWTGYDCMGVARNQSSSGSLSFPSAFNITDVNQNFSGNFEIEPGIDLDEDGRVDFLIANANKIELIGNQTRLGSQDTLCLSGPDINRNDQYGLPGIVSGDIDGDGKVDFAVMGVNSSISSEPFVNVYRNISEAPGDFAFSSFDTTIIPRYGMIPFAGIIYPYLLDFDGDGKLDIVGQSSDKFYVMLNTSTPGFPSFAPEVQLLNTPNYNRKIEFADLNQDGKLDAFFSISISSSDEIRVYINESTIGNPAMSYACSIPTSVSGYEEMELGDVNGDGLWDIVGVVGGNPDVFVHLGQLGLGILNDLSDPICPETLFPIAVEAALDFDPSNSFLIQLSDSSGSFASPFILDSIPGTNLDTAWVQIPDSFPASQSYRLKLISTMPYREAMYSGTLDVLSGVSLTISPDTSVCKGTVLALQAGGGTNYEWFPSSGLSNALISNPSAIIDTTITYWITVLDTTTGCEAIDSVIITSLILPYTISTDSSVCEGDSLPLFATGGTDYQWTPGIGLSDSNSSTPIWTALSNITYTVTIIDSISGCQQIDSVQLGVFNLPLVDAGMDTSICPTDTAILIATSSTNLGIDWQPASTLTSNNQLTVGAFPSVSTEYILTVQDNNGCSNSDTVWVDVNSDSLLIGSIVQSNGLPMPATKVLIIEFNPVDSSLAAVDSFLTNSQGFFSYQTNLPDFYLKVIPDSATYPMELPSYFDSSVVWQTATSITLDCGELSISMNTLQGQNPGGSGFIGGLISQGAGKKDSVAVPDLTLILMDASLNPVQLTQTDPNGLFQFDDLSLGTYHLWADKPFVDNAIAPIITLTADTMVREDLYFILHPTWLEWIHTVSTALTPAHQDWTFDLFPNPSHEAIQIQWTLPNAAAVDMVLSDLAGKQLETKRAQGQAYSEEWNISNLASGIYLFTCKPEGMPPTYMRIIKK